MSATDQQSAALLISRRSNGGAATTRRCSYRTKASATVGALSQADGPSHNPVSPATRVSQGAADCLSANARMPAEGEALLAWMTAHEDRWRLAAAAATPDPVS